MATRGNAKLQTLERPSPEERKLSKRLNELDDGGDEWAWNWCYKELERRRANIVKQREAFALENALSNG